MMGTLSQHLATEKPLILDGGLATALEQTLNRILTSRLWSAEVLVNSPDAIRQVHEQYFKAGANIAITASYQASVPGFRHELGISEAEAVGFIRKSVELAQEARTSVRHQRETRKTQSTDTESTSHDFIRTHALSNERMLVVGSVGPYGAYLADGSEYTGKYNPMPSREEFKAFHRPRIRALLDAGVDCLACETMPSFVELEALLQALEEEREQRPQAHETAIVEAWVSCTLHPDTVDAISDGTPLKEVFELLESSSCVVAVGFNCIDFHRASAALKAARTLTRKPLLVYPNSGETWDATAKQWRVGNNTAEVGVEVKGQSNRPSFDATLVKAAVREWLDLGASIIGGCCRTDTRFVAAVRKACIEYSEQRL